MQQLSDNVRLVMVPSNSPFLFDLESIAQSAGAQDGEFVAPAVPQPQDIVPVEPTPTPAPGN